MLVSASDPSAVIKLSERESRSPSEIWREGHVCQINSCILGTSPAPPEESLHSYLHKPWLKHMSNGETTEKVGISANIFCLEYLSKTNKCNLSHWCSSQFWLPRIINSIRFYKTHLMQSLNYRKLLITCFFMVNIIHIVIKNRIDEK